MRDISRDIGKPPATVFSYLLHHGGMEPRRKVRRAGCLSFVIGKPSPGLANGRSARSIAAELGRSPSAISREVSRNAGTAKYRAELAEKAFRKRAKRPKESLLGSNRPLLSTAFQFSPPMAI
jgi:hypothetical protein